MSKKRNASQDSVVDLHFHPTVHIYISLNILIIHFITSFNNIFFYTEYLQCVFVDTYNKLTFIKVTEFINIFEILVLK